MTYTREEWEPAATEASKVSEQAWMSFSTALTLVEGTKAYQKVFEDALIKAYIELADVERERDITITHLQQERDELNKKLAAAEQGKMWGNYLDVKQERDRLRELLKAARRGLVVTYWPFLCKEIDEALAQPEDLTPPWNDS